MNVSSPPKKPDVIHYSPSTGLASTLQRDEDIPYVPADSVEQLQRERDQLLKACQTVVRAVESEEYQAWEGLAMTMVARGYGHGYSGEQFLHTVRAAIATCQNG